jgi:X-Pro dipeptidyl-peptidase
LKRRHTITIIAAVTCLAAALLTGPVATAAPKYGSLEETLIVPTRHGDIYMEVVRPTLNDKPIKAPTVLTYSPYSVLGRNGDADRYVSRGIARAFADVVGTGNSGGCYDYGGKRDKETAYDVIEWLAKRRWSTGKIGMIGGSYNGTTQYAAAIEQPPHLTTIVPEAAINRWYDYAYSGGIRYALNNENPSDEGLDTPLGFDFGFAMPPPVDVEDPTWADRVASTITPCDELEHTQHGYDDTPDYDKFWRDRDYIRHADKINIPVLISHNWGDWNVKQEEAFKMFNAIKNSPKKALYMGTRYSGHGTPDGKYDQTVDAWFDHYLLGKDNGIENLPSVTSQTSDMDGPGKFISGRPVTMPITLYAQEAPKTNPADYEWKLLPEPPAKNSPLKSVAEFPSTNVNTESHANHHSRNNHDWFWFESPELARDTRIFGSIKVKLWSTIGREWITFTPTIVDIDPACHLAVAGQHVGDPQCTLEPEPARRLHSVTRGWLDSRYRNGLSKQVPIEPGKSFGATIVEKPQDYVFKKGHQIGLNIQTEILEWSLPKPYPGCDAADRSCVWLQIDWAKGKTKVVLPVVMDEQGHMDLFSAGSHSH